MLVVSSLAAVIGDMLFVWWAKKDTHPAWTWILGIVLVNIAAIVWMNAIRKGIDAATAITFYALFTVAGCSFLGFVIFKEPLSVTNVIGMILALVALLLISI